MKRAKLAVPKEAPQPIRIDIGCGKRPKEGFAGLDAIDFGQKYVHDIRKGLPFKANTVDEVYSSHFVEHLDWSERVAFFNDLYRALKPGSQATIITPYWAHACFYGDPTHKAPMSEWYRLYLDKNWRATEAPHTSYTCHFPIDQQTVVGTFDQRLMTRVEEVQRTSMETQINATRDLIITLKKG